jgi:MarR family transcriptional regulator, organic hydroperoxide resistance regulator
MDKKELVKEALVLQRETVKLLRRFEPKPWIELNLTLAQLKSLFFIAATDKTNFKKVAEALNVTPPNVTGIIDKLVEQGLVTRTENPEDRRIMILQATEKGHELLISLRESHINQMIQVLDNLTPESLNTLISGYKDLKKAAEQYVERTLSQ